MTTKTLDADIYSDVDRAIAADEAERQREIDALRAPDAPPHDAVFSAVLPSARQPHHVYDARELANMADLTARLGRPLERVLAVGLAMLTSARQRAAPSSERDRDLEHLTKVLCYIHSTYDIPKSRYTTDLLELIENANLDVSQPMTTKLARAYARANPEHLTINQLAAKLRIPHHAANNLRMAARVQRAYRDRASAKQTGAAVPPRRERIRTGYLLPLHYGTPLFYHETDEALTKDTLAYDHAHSPLYLFHAMAWGWRMYADFLDRHGRVECPYSNLDVSQLRKDNPRDGSGILAFKFAAKIMAEKGTGGAITLPMPAFECAAHEHPNWEEAMVVSRRSDMTKPKYTRLSSLQRMIVAECPRNRLKEVFSPRVLVKLEHQIETGKL